MNKKLAGLCVLSMLIFINAGCWDVRDISNRAFITGIGLDAPDDPHLKYRVTLSMPKPIKIRNRAEELVSIEYSVEAESIAGAVERLQARISRDLDFAHLRGIIIGEKLARQQRFDDIVHFFEKTPKVALRTQILFAQGNNAEDILKVRPIFDRYVTGEFVSLAEAGRDLGIARIHTFNDVLQDLRETNGSAYSSRVVVSQENGQKFGELIGGAVLQNWRLVGWLDANETKAANLLEKTNTKAVIEIKEGSSHFSYVIYQKRVKIDPEFKNGRLSFRVKVSTSGEITESEGKAQEITGPKDIARLQKAVSGVITDQVYTAINKSQKEFEVDYLGFGQALKRNEPKVYSKLNWSEVYPQVPVNVQVEARIPRFGIER